KITKCKRKTIPTTMTMMQRNDIKCDCTKNDDTATKSYLKAVVLKQQYQKQEHQKQQYQNKDTRMMIPE
ncbi:36490_t:CDS:1, partial [Gigaspora margarita]